MNPFLLYNNINFAVSDYKYIVHCQFYTVTMLQCTKLQKARDVFNILLSYRMYNTTELHAIVTLTVLYITACYNVMVTLRHNNNNYPSAGIHRYAHTNNIHTNYDVHCSILLWIEAHIYITYGETS